MSPQAVLSGTEAVPRTAWTVRPNPEFDCSRKKTLCALQGNLSLRWSRGPVAAWMACNKHQGREDKPQQHLFKTQSFTTLLPFCPKQTDQNTKTGFTTFGKTSHTPNAFFQQFQSSLVSQTFYHKNPCKNRLNTEASPAQLIWILGRRF